MNTIRPDRPCDKSCARRAHPMAECDCTRSEPATIADTLTRAELLQRLERFIAQRPGFNPANYGDSASYRADARTATRQLNDARAMLAAIGWRESITADMIRAALRSGGRLTLRDDGMLDYCTGQYWPTEYRAGVCRALASILWDYWRDNMPTERNTDGKIPGPNRFGGAMSPGDYLRRTARAELGRSIADRWFR